MAARRDPKPGLYIVSAHHSYSLYFNKPADGTYGWAGADYGLWGKGVLEAIDKGWPPRLSAIVTAFPSRWRR